MNISNQCSQTSPPVTRKKVSRWQTTIERLNSSLTDQPNDAPWSRTRESSPNGLTCLRIWPGTRSWVIELDFIVDARSKILSRWPHSFATNPYLPIDGSRSPSLYSVCRKRHQKICFCCSNCNQLFPQYLDTLPRTRHTEVSLLWKNSKFLGPGKGVPRTEVVKGGAKAPMGVTS